MRGRFRGREESLGASSLDPLPLSMNTILIATSRAKPISWVTTNHVRTRQILDDASTYEFGLISGDRLRHLIERSCGPTAV